MALPIRSDDATTPDTARAAAQDALLVQRVRRGDGAAYGELVSRHMRRAFSIAFRILEHREDAEDVVQDAFIRALQRIDRLDVTRPFAPWLFRIVVNQALNFRRARRVRATSAIPESTPARGATPDREAERAALGHQLRAALDRLPEKQRVIVQLADLEELTSAEIGEILDLAGGTVRWHLHQARRTLRASLAGLEEEI